MTFQSSIQNRFATLTYLALVAMLALIALASSRELLSLLLVLAANLPEQVGIVNLALLAVLAALAVAGLIAVLRLPPGIALALAVAALVATRLAALLFIEPELVRDMAAYDALARGVLDGECCFGLRPMGYPILLATTYGLRLDGDLVNFAAALAAAPLLWLIGRSLNGERSGVLAVYLYAVTPSLVLFSGVLMTETVYSTVLLAAIAPFARGPGMSRSALSGLLLGISQYFRATSVFLAPVFLIALVARRAWRATAAFALLLTVALLPVLAATGGVSTSTIGGLSLMMGTNQQSVGWYNQADVELYASWGVDREARAVQEAVRRVTSDPPGFAMLSLRKAHSMWAQEYYGVTFALGDAAAPATDQAAARLASQAVYVGLLIAAVAAAWRFRQVRPLTVWLVLGVFAAVAAIHVFVEVQPRYHAYLVPLFVVLAASATSSLSTRPDGKRDAREF